MNPFEIPWTFKTWLSKFESVDLPIGDLARDVADDASFPDTEDKTVIISHLRNKRACSSAIDTFETVWKFYKAST